MKHDFGRLMAALFVWGVAVAAQAQPVTVLRYEVTGGAPVVLQSPAQTFTPSSYLNARGLSMAIEGIPPPSYNTFNVDFAARLGGSLAVGVYEGTLSNGGYATPRLNLYTGNDGLCSGPTTGRFVVLEHVLLPNGTVDRAAIDFDGTCETYAGPSRRIYGELRFNSAVPLSSSRAAGWTTPNPFAFKPRDTLAPSTQVISNEITVYGINAPSPISITGGEYSVNGGPYTSAPTTVVNRDVVRVRTTSPAGAGSTSALLTIGGVSAAFVASNYAPGQAQSGFYYHRMPGSLAPEATRLDTIPGAYFEPNISSTFGVVFVTYLESGDFHLIGFTTKDQKAPPVGAYENAADANLAGPRLSVDVSGQNCFADFGRYVVLDAEYSAQDTVVRLAVNFELQCSDNASLYGELRYNSTVPYTFQEAPGATQPDPFALLVQSPAMPNSVQQTNSVTVYGTNAPSPISIAGGEYSVNGGAFTAASGTVQPLDHVVVRFLAGPLPGDTRTATLTIGGQTASASVATYRQGSALTGMYVRYRTHLPAFAVDHLFLAPFETIEQADSPGIAFQMFGQFDHHANATFIGPAGALLAPGLYMNPTSLPTPGRIQAHYAVDGSSCGLEDSPASYVRIHEIEYSALHRVSRFAADFEQVFCGDPIPLYGEIRFNSTVPFSKLAPPAPAAVDFSADGKSDLLFQSGDGSVLAWTMNGTQPLATKSLFGAGTGWMVTHLADLDGDRKADIFFKHVDGRVYVYQMDGLTVVGGKELLPAGLGWSVSHTADLNGDGKADLILKHTDGRAHLWLMDGTNIIGSASLLPAASGWNVVGTGDLNGDGKADIVFMHDDGRGYVYLMNGTTIIGSTGFLSAGSGWTVSHVADMNGDGKSDLVFRHTDGSAYLFLMNGTAFGAGVSLLGPGTGWSVTHTGDFNGDGKDDFVFKHTDGRAHVRLMNGTAILSAADVLPAASGWSVTQLYDLNGDGKKDLVFRHTDGRITVRLMDGLATLSSANLIGAGNWSVVPESSH